MSELDAERRERLATAILGRICNVSNLPEWMIVPALGRSMRPLADLVVDALAPLIAGWLAESEAGALREAADAWPREINIEAIRRELAHFDDLRDVPPEYTPAAWLRDRADRIGGTR